jgi:hypothetical protein
MSLAQEREVSEVDVLVFDGAGNNEYAYSSTAYAIIDGGTPVETNVAAIRNFTVRLRPTEGTNDVDLWVIANAHAKLGSITPGITKSALIATLEASETEAGVVQGPTFTPFPMWGILKNVTISAPAGLSPGNVVNLTRMVAKIDVSLTPAAQSRFILTSVRLYNRWETGRIVPVEANGNWTYTPSAGPYAILPSLPAATAKTAGSYRDFLPTSGAAVEDTIYTFEAQKGVPYTSTYEQNTCLVVGGKYNSPSSPTTYYRVDFADSNGDALHLLRNYRYDVVIQSVSGPGFPTEDDALRALPVNMTANIIEWRESGMNHVVIDGQYMLSVSRDDILFSQSSGTETINVFTDHEDGWEVDVTSPPFPDWFTITSPAPASDIVTGAKDQVIPLVMQLANPLPSGTAYREGEFYIVAGRLKKLIKVTLLPLVFDHISSTADIPRAGGTAPTVGGAPLTMAFTGSYTGLFDVNAYAGATPGTLGTTPVGVNTNSSKIVHSVTIFPNNTWSPRYITYTYSGTGIPEQTIDPVTVSNLQPGYSISITGITPAAPISGAGGAYTFNLSGDFPQGVQIYAVLENTTTLASSTLMAVQANQATVQLNINANPNATTRNIQIVAEHSGTGLPITVLATYSQQEKPTLNFVSISSTANIPSAGGSPPTVGGAPLTMNFTGNYSGPIVVNAYASATSGALGTTLVGTYSNNSLTAHPVYITDPNNTWSPRYITYTYSGTGIPAQTIDPVNIKNIQQGYSISITGITPSATINDGGGIYTFTLAGTFPAGVEIYARLAASPYTVASNTVQLTANQASVQLTINSNPSTTTARQLQIVAVHSATSLPVTVLATYTQVAGDFFTDKGHEYQLVFWQMATNLPLNTNVQIPATCNVYMNGHSVEKTVVTLDAVSASDFTYSFFNTPLVTWLQGGGKALGESMSFNDLLPFGVNHNRHIFIVNKLSDYVHFARTDPNDPYDGSVTDRVYLSNGYNTRGFFKPVRDSQTAWIFYTYSEISYAATSGSLRWDHSIYFYLLVHR